MSMNTEPRPRRPQTSGRNEGSIWFRHDRRVRVGEVSLPNGSRRTIQRPTRRDARKALKYLQATIKAPADLPPNCSLGRFLLVWLERTVKERDPKTDRGY